MLFDLKDTLFNQNHEGCNQERHTQLAELLCVARSVILTHAWPADKLLPNICNFDR